jgi:ribose transport system ATP-binding protein
MRTLFGDIPKSGGQITLRGKRYQPRSPQDAMSRGVFLIPEDRGIHGLMLSKSIAENLILVVLRHLIGRLGLLRFSDGRNQARRMMQVLEIRAIGVDQTVGELSGGNQQKVVLAKTLTFGADVLLLDEPTFGVDIGATYEIIAHVRTMAEKGITVLWVSSDLLEVIRVADRIVVLRDGIIGATLGADEAGESTEDALIAMMQRRQFRRPVATTHVGHAAC